VLGQDDDPGEINYHTGEENSLRKLPIPDVGRSDERDAQHNRLLRAAGKNQLANMDTQLTFDAPLDRVSVTARLDNPQFGIHVAAATVAVPVPSAAEGRRHRHNPRPEGRVSRSAPSRTSG
jgi:hypothetical protein